MGGILDIDGSRNQLRTPTHTYLGVFLASRVLLPIYSDSKRKMFSIPLHKDVAILLTSPPAFEFDVAPRFTILFDFN